MCQVQTGLLLDNEGCIVGIERIVISDYNNGFMHAVLCILTVLIAVFKMAAFTSPVEFNVSRIAIVMF